MGDAVGRDAVLVGEDAADPDRRGHLVFGCADDACTHGPGSLSEGFVDGDCIECNFHQGVFNIKTGAVVQPPCIVPVRTYPAVVEDGVVYIEYEPSAADPVKS
jgi:nitrite reductase/ring-hydroxylating ferredoxin subunit